MLTLLLMTAPDVDTADDITVLYRNYERYLLTVAKNHVKTDEDAEDAVNEAFLYLINKGMVPKVDDPKALTILACVVKERAINIYKKDHMRRPEDIDEHLELSGGDAGPDVILVLKDAIGRLPAELREALILSFYNGLTSEEIARIQNIKKDTAQKRIKKAREQLRRMLSEDEE